jgi:hypothetical protein
MLQSYRIRRHPTNRSQGTPNETLEENSRMKPTFRKHIQTELMLTGVFDPIIHGKLMSMWMWRGKSLEFVPIDAERSAKECSWGQKNAF